MERETKLTLNLIKSAETLARTRYPDQDSVVAAALTGGGSVLTSVYTEARVDSACLCAETGAICEAHKLGESIVASVCLMRDAKTDRFRVLAACGVCQERLAFWGLDVEIAVPLDGDEVRYWQGKMLRELRPFYWDDNAVKHD